MLDRKLLSSQILQHMKIHADNPHMQETLKLLRKCHREIRAGEKMREAQRDVFDQMVRNGLDTRNMR
jgi:hypothetical protein